MAIEHLPSNAISTFPSSRRTGVDPYSRFTTEYNLVDIVNRVSSGSFVTSLTGGSIIDFTIKGYHFIADLSQLSTATRNGDAIYAYAIIGAASTENPLDSALMGYNGAIQTTIDQNDKFIGVCFSNSGTETFSSLSSGYEVYSLKLTVKSGNTQILAEESKALIPTLTEAEVLELWNTYF